MKIAILAAGDSKYFPVIIDKPKSLYHLNGEIQLRRVIETAKKFVVEEDIIIVAGYKANLMRKYVKENYPKIDFRVNERYKEPAVYSFRKAVDGIDDDVVFMFADESISEKNVRRISESKRSMSILCHDTFYYYSLGILKLSKKYIHIFDDDNYLSMEYMKDVYCFANNKKEYDGAFTIDSGICIGYMIIDIVRRIGKIQKVENPIETYKGEDIDFLHYCPEKEYIADLDSIRDTDEYKNNWLLRFYSDHISNRLRRIIELLKK